MSLPSLFPEFDADADRMARAALAALLKVGRGISPGAVVYVTVMHVQKLIGEEFEATLDNDPGFLEILDFMCAISNEHGRPAGWPPGEGPPEFEQLRREWVQGETMLHARLFAQAGQPYLSELILRDYSAFRRSCAAAGEIFVRSCVFQDDQ